MAMVTPEVYYFAQCVKAMALAKEEKSKAEIIAKESHLKLTEMKEAQEKAKNDAMFAGQYTYLAIHDANGSIDLTMLAEKLMSVIYNEKEAEKNLSEAKEKEKEASDEYDKAIYNNEVANKNYSDAVNKMETAWKTAQDSVKLNLNKIN
jgi:hypothetical protein